MLVSVVFLISCIITARFLKRRKMKLASALYSILFSVTLVIIMLAVDSKMIGFAFSNILGGSLYSELHRAILRMFAENIYGFSVVTLIALSISVQLAIAIYCATKKAVRHFCASVDAERKFKKVYFRYAPSVRNLYLPKRINLLYCRMLN